MPILKFSITYLGMSLSEFPHSEISGSKIVCISPKLIAAYHVFHRLPVPRHSPCALCSLTLIFSSRILHLPTRLFAKIVVFTLIMFRSVYSVFKVRLEFPFQGPQN